MEGLSAQCSVALRVLEVPQLAVALEASFAPLDSLAAARPVSPRWALIRPAPLSSFTWTPDGRQIITVRPCLSSRKLAVASAYPASEFSAAHQAGNVDLQPQKQYCKILNFLPW